MASDDGYGDAVVILIGLGVSAMAINRAFGTESAHPCEGVDCPPGEVCQAGECISG